MRGKKPENKENTERCIFPENTDIHLYGTDIEYCKKQQII